MTPVLRFRFACKVTLELFEIARVLVRVDHVARFIVNANHGVMGAAEKLGVTDCVRDCVRIAVPQRTEWQRVAD